MYYIEKKLYRKAKKNIDVNNISPVICHMLVDKIIKMMYNKPVVLYKLYKIHFLLELFCIS